MVQELKWHQITASDASAEWDPRLGITIYMVISGDQQIGSLFPDIRIIHAYIKIFTSITETPLSGLRRRVNYIYILFYSHNCDRYSYLGLSMQCSGEAFPCQCKRHKKCGLNPWAGKIPWSKKWQPTLVFLPGKFHGQKALVGYTPWGHNELDMTEWLSTHTHTHTHTHTFVFTSELKCNYA